MRTLLWLIPLLPFFGFLINGLFGRRLSKTVAAFVGVGSVASSFGIAVYLFASLFTGPEAPRLLEAGLGEWFSVIDLRVNFQLLLDPLSMMMVLVVAGVGSLIHLYSVGYMHDDEGFARFFAYLNLFVFSMLILVLGGNYLLMFVGWEGVGLCSYLLIGFWFKNRDYTYAANKAFLMNRIGDLGFLLALFLMAVTFGSLEFKNVFEQVKHFEVGAPVLLAIALLLFVGATGKSAQIPLYTWLPDAMAGPTPVSALIHAATMVTAGVYMVLRSGAIYVQAPVALDVVAWIGGATALLAALIALSQRDIKKVLAYSTVSQLGYMFMALGVSAFTSSYFHVFTHAFFKALLFLGAGSVIHAVSGEQDLRRMGGLRKHLPITYFTFLIATLAIAGIPPFAGFFSKDEILAHAFEHNVGLYALGQGVAFLTAFYMFRLFFLAFHGEFRGTEEQKHHLHESPWTMTVPLLVLAVFSAGAGFLGLPHVFAHHHLLAEFLKPSLPDVAEVPAEAVVEYALMGVAVLMSLVAIGVAWWMYVKKSLRPKADREKTGFATTASLAKFWVDELYDAAVVRPLQSASAFAHRWLDTWVLGGAMNGVGKVARGGGSLLSRLQNGNIEFYLFAMTSAVILLVFVAYWKLG